jgi:hypothetical protein
VSYSSTVSIAELDSTGTTIQREVTLTGPSLPFMETEWGGENQLVTTWYPGNPTEGTQQNLGPREVPSTWRGDWRRTMMGGTPTPYLDETGILSSIVDPSTLRDSLEDIFRAGRRLRVTWSTQQQPDGTSPQAYPITGSIIREGRAKSWKFTHRTIHDIQWEITFEWVSRGGTTPRVTSTRDDTLTSTSPPYSAAIMALIDASQEAQDQALAPSALTLGTYEAYAGGPLDLMTTLSLTSGQLQLDLVDANVIGSNIANQPIQVAQIALAQAADALNTSQTAYQEFSAVPAEVMSANDDAVSVLTTYALFGPVMDAAIQAEIAAFTFYTAIRKAVPTHSSSLNGKNSVAQTPDPGTIITVYLAKDGDTPQKISQQFYKTPDHAVDILRANRLSWYVTSFPKGKQLVIPVISSSTQTV